jgi:hypothetical protein
MAELAALEPEFRIALNIILNHTYDLMQTGDLTHEQHKDMRLIHESALSMLSMFEDASPDHTLQAHHTHDLIQLAHEFRTPLNAIIGFSHTLLEYPRMYEGASLPAETQDRVMEMHEIGWMLMYRLHDALHAA